MHVLDMIFFWANAKPNHPAIIQPGTIMTYRALAEAIEAASLRISQYQLHSAESVAVMVDNPVHQLIVLFALLRCGFSGSLINDSLLTHIGAAGITTLISENASDALPDSKHIKFDNLWLLASSNAVSKNDAGAGETLTLGKIISFTSGTTGSPKKFVLTHDSLMTRINVAATMRSLNFSRVLIVPGLDSIFGLVRTCTVLAVGKTACFAGSGELMLRLVSAYRIDMIVASTLQAHSLAEICERDSGYSLESLVNVLISGAYPSKDVVKLIQTKMCRQVIIDYASTETGLIATAPYHMIEHVPGAVGFLVPWVDLEVVDGSGTPLSANSEGLIRIRDRQFVKSFSVNYPVAQIDDNDIWFYPGDRGHVTENGVLCIAGRGDDVINRGGVKLSALIMEEALVSCDGIRDAGVCGVRDDTGMEGVWIAVVVDENFDMLVFRKRLAENDGLFQLFSDNIDEIFSVDQIPRSSLGKIKRHELREMLLDIKRNTHAQK